jgi:hypothetical protein
MLTYTLDDVIRDMMDHSETRLSAEARNTVNFCRSTHPCGTGKTDLERVQEVRCAIVGRDVHPRFREQLERLARKAIKAAA